MIATTVKTEEKAIEILNINGYTSAVERKSCHCECGETLCIMIGDAWVGVCDACGDDYAFEDEVLVKL